MEGKKLSIRALINSTLRNFRISEDSRAEIYGSTYHYSRLRYTFPGDVMAVTLVYLSSFMSSIWHVICNNFNRRVFFIFSQFSCLVQYILYCNFSSNWLAVVLFPLTSLVYVRYFRSCKDFFESYSIEFPSKRLRVGFSPALSVSKQPSWEAPDWLANWFCY